MNNLKYLVSVCGRGQNTENEYTSHVVAIIFFLLPAYSALIAKNEFQAKSSFSIKLEVVLCYTVLNMLINLFKPDLTLSSSSTTSRELLPQFSTCSG